MQNKIVNKYIADDGTEFFSEVKCREYERKQEIFNRCLVEETDFYYVLRASSWQDMLDCAAFMNISIVDDPIEGELFILYYNPIELKWFIDSIENFITEIESHLFCLRRHLNGGNKLKKQPSQLG